MSATRLSLETDLRYSWRDTDPNSYAVPSTQIWSWLNRAVREINADLLMVEKDGTIVGDGVLSYFTILGSTALTLASDVLGIRSFSHSDGIIDGPVTIEEIDRFTANGQIVSGLPYKYALWGGKVLFDRIPASGTVITGHYYGEPTDMSIVAGGAGDATAPQAPLQQFDGVIEAKAKQIRAGDDGDLGKFDQFQGLYDRLKIPLIRLIESGGKHQTLSNTIPHRRL